MADVRGELAHRVRMQQQQWFSDIQDGIIPPTATIFSQDKNGRVIGANQVSTIPPSLLSPQTSFAPKPLAMKLIYLLRCSAHRPLTSAVVPALVVVAACA